MNQNGAALTLLLLWAKGNLFGGSLGLFAGACGILYGLFVKHFRTYGFYGFTSKEPEMIEPRWYHRVIVVVVSMLVFKMCGRTLIENL